MQIETTMSYQYTPFRIAKVKGSNNAKCWQGHRESESLTHGWWEFTMEQSL